LGMARSMLAFSRSCATLSIGSSATMRRSHERRVVARVRPRHGQPRVDRLGLGSPGPSLLGGNSGEARLTPQRSTSARATCAPEAQASEINSDRVTSATSTAWPDAIPSPSGPMEETKQCRRLAATIAKQNARPRPRRDLAHRRQATADGGGERPMTPTTASTPAVARSTAPQALNGETRG
jgi:hypothetical protein